MLAIPVSRMKLPARPSPKVKAAAQQRFAAGVRALGFDPDHRWVGGYADYEWDHLRLALAAHGVDVTNRDVPEFGCNVGGSCHSHNRSPLVDISANPVASVARYRP